MFIFYQPGSPNLEAWSKLGDFYSGQPIRVEAVFLGLVFFLAYRFYSLDGLFGFLVPILQLNTMSFVEKLDPEALAYFNDVAKRPFNEQAVAFLNAYWPEVHTQAEFIFR
jgi:hypothetical protein